MKGLFIPVCLFNFLFCLNVSSQIAITKKPYFDEGKLLTHIENLSSDAFEGRRTGTKGALKAQKYIINEFIKSGVKPLGKAFEQQFIFTEHRKSYTATNILGFIKGKSKQKQCIVISAHYDHEGIKGGEIYNGADDNASGISALFAFAEHFKKFQPEHSVILAAFDAEELGIRGSKYFVNNAVGSGKDIVMNINMDMISRSEKKELFVVGARNNETLKKVILRNKPICQSIKISFGHDGHDTLDNWTYSSDHVSFYKKDIPFLYFGVEDHEDYHEPTYYFEKIDPTFYKQAVYEIISIFNKIDLLTF